MRAAVGAAVFTAVIGLSGALTQDHDHDHSHDHDHGHHHDHGHDHAKDGETRSAGAHVHGLAGLQMVITADGLSADLSGAAWNFLGFERAPETDAERQAVADARAALEDPVALLGPRKGAQCEAGDVAVDLGAAEGGHKDVTASYTLTCARADRLTKFEPALFSTFDRLETLEVEVISDSGAVVLSLTAGDPVITLK